MKKLLMSTIIVLMVSLFAVVPVFAKTTVIKGEITELNLGAVPPTLAILTNQGETLTIVFPEGFEVPTLTIGDTVLIKGKTDADGKLAVESIKVIGKGKSDEAEGSKVTSAYCDPDKQDKPHPFAVKIAAKAAELGYEEVDEKWVMEQFCSGVGMGQIMLALKTSEKLEGTEGAATPQEILKARTDGSGWGKIWQENKLIGSEKSVEVPAGQQKKTEHGNPNK